MVVDTSALVAILQREPERRAFIEAIEAADARLMSVATFVEISIVIEARHGAEGLRDLDHFIGRAGIELVPADAEHGKVACSAFSRFGKGRHRAGLNHGAAFGRTRDLDGRAAPLPGGRLRAYGRHDGGCGLPLSRPGRPHGDASVMLLHVFEEAGIREFEPRSIDGSHEPRGSGERYH